MIAEKVSSKDICREVGVEYRQWNEVMKRIAGHIKEGGKEVINHHVGTFYLANRAARQYRLKGVLYQSVERKVIALRGPRFPADINVRQGYRVRFFPFNQPSLEQQFVILDGSESVSWTGHYENLQVSFPAVPSSVRVDATFHDGEVPENEPGESSIEIKLTVNTTHEGHKNFVTATGVEQQEVENSIRFSFLHDDPEVIDVDIHVKPNVIALTNFLGNINIEPLVDLVVDP